MGRLIELISDGPEPLIKLLDVLLNTSHGLLGYLCRLIHDTWFTNGRTERYKLRPDCLAVASSVALKPVPQSHRLTRIYPNERPRSRECVTA